MMLSKIVLFTTVFVAVCFRNSEGTDVLRCRTDDVFSRVANENKNKIMVPVLVKSSSYNDQTIVNTLKQSKFGTIIILHVDMSQCPISVSYFSRYGGESYPLLYFMMKGKLYKKVWNATMDLRKFCIDASQNQSAIWSSKTVAESIEWEIKAMNSPAFGEAKAKNKNLALIVGLGATGLAAGAAGLVTVLNNVKRNNMNPGTSEP